MSQSCEAFEQGHKIELNVTDLKQYLYCPRIPYYFYVMPVPRPITYKMQHGVQEHVELDRLEKRRGYRSYGLTEGKRLFHLQLKSETLGLYGKPDLVITYEKKGVTQYLPVEFKHTEKGLFTNAKYQLAAYAMLLEEHFQVPVCEGIVYQIPTKAYNIIKITDPMRKHVKDSLSAIRRMMLEETFPEPKSRSRCTDCEYRRYCNDIY
ncbi:CRISPR-associated protein Cas4 [Effusibacillus consociatus]|uniref:CRISPR-associated exonuclease Cas4 n=1 Tax=Effusibacillus consociatus TaxID=1117041 RepID=A0ABV9Q6K6_9BACL